MGSQDRKFAATIIERETSKGIYRLILDGSDPYPSWELFLAKSEWVDDGDGETGPMPREEIGSWEELSSGFGRVTMDEAIDHHEWQEEIGQSS